MFAVLVRRQGKLPPLDGLVYISSQPSCTILGALLLWAWLATVGSGVSDGSVFLCEFSFTLALCFVALHTSPTKVHANNSYYGLSIGFTAFFSSSRWGASAAGPSTRPWASCRSSMARARRRRFGFGSWGPSLAALSWASSSTS